MEIKDLLGLSKPIIKLIDVIARGIGAVTRPMLIRSEADAKAYEILTISGAIKNAGVDKLQYKNGVVIVEDMAGKVQVAEISADGRVGLRVSHEEIHRQQNIENVVVGAAEILKLNHNTADEKPVDQDWINEFFDKVRLVSSVEMQSIWSKILADEVCTPGTYSIRTMNTLKQMTKEEANLFSRFAEVRLVQPGIRECFAYNGNEDGLGLFSGGLSFGEVQALESIGLLYTRSGLGIDIKASDVKQNIVFEHGGMVLALECDPDKIPKKIPIIGFTMVGFELSQLIKAKENIMIFKEIKKFMQADGVRVKVFNVITKDGVGGYKVGPELEI